MNEYLNIGGVLFIAAFAIIGGLIGAIAWLVTRMTGYCNAHPGLHLRTGGCWNWRAFEHPERDVREGTR